MSKKSGFFYVMLTMFASMFASHTYARENNSKYQPSAPTGGGGGDGRGIRSYGTKPAYMKDKVLYKNWGDRIYVSVGHVYWATRALAEANR